MNRSGTIALFLACVTLACSSSGSPGEASDANAGEAETPADPAAATVEIDEWDVPWPDTRPRDPYVGPSGDVYFVGQRDDYVARLDPEAGTFERWDLPEGAGPHNLIVDEVGSVWYAGNRAAHIGRLDPETGEIETIPMPDPEARDPHTLVFDAEGDVWFTVQGGNRVGHLEVESREVEILEVPTPGARPYGIAVAGDGDVWFTEFGSYKVGVVDPSTMEIEEIELPRRDARPRRVGITSDGSVWTVDYAGGRLSRIEPETREIREWPMPGGESARPYGMAVDAADRVWFVETGLDPNRFVGFDPETGSFTEPVPIPSGGGTVRHMVHHAPTQTVWFGTDANTIGRARLPE